MSLAADQYRRNTEALVAWSSLLLAQLWENVAESGDWATTTDLATSVMIHAKRQEAYASWAYLAQELALDGAFIGLSSQEERLRFPLPEPAEPIVPVEPIPALDLDLASDEPEPLWEQNWKVPAFDYDLIASVPEAPVTPGFDVAPVVRDAQFARSGARLSELNARAPAGVAAMQRAGVPKAEAIKVSTGRAISLVSSEVPVIARTVPAAAVEVQSSAWSRWRRVPSPGACPFCLMLASRGAVYRSASAAAQGHNNCRCTTEVEVNPNRAAEIRIHPNDLREIRVRTNKGRSYVMDLGSDYWRFLNRAGTPALEFVPFDQAA